MTRLFWCPKCQGTFTLIPHIVLQHGVKSFEGKKYA